MMLNTIKKNHFLCFPGHLGIKKSNIERSLFLKIPKIFCTIIFIAILYRSNKKRNQYLYYQNFSKSYT